MKNGTVHHKATDGQRRDIAATIVAAIPHDLSFKEAQEIIGGKGPFIANIREVFTSRRLTIVPAGGVWFNLEVIDVDPMTVVALANYEVKDWKYLGPQYTGKRVRRVKLIHLGHNNNLNEARARADGMGYRLVGGQMMEPFRNKFPKYNDTGPIVFGGDEWLNPHGETRVVAYLHDISNYELLRAFRKSNSLFDKVCRWMVTLK
ncbi:MAG: hypothetical protein AAB451_00415 [Patescibacteria group bacterium]